MLLLLRLPAAREGYVAWPLIGLRRTVRIDDRLVTLDFVESPWT